MISYHQIASKDDKKFHRIARKVLGNDYGAATDEANEAFIKAYKAGTENKRVNDARRAANLIVLRWLRDYGVINWQSIDEPQIKRKPVKYAADGFVSDKVKERKFKSGDGLWSKKL